MFTRRIGSLLKRASFSGCALRRALSTRLHPLALNGCFVLRNSTGDVPRITWRAVLDLDQTDDSAFKLRRFIECDTPINLNSDLKVGNLPKDQPQITRLVNFANNTIYESVKLRWMEDKHDLVVDYPICLPDDDVYRNRNIIIDRIKRNIERCRKILAFQDNAQSDIAAEMSKIGIAVHWDKFRIAKYKKE
jgi:hypothetical protein